MLICNGKVSIGLEATPGGTPVVPKLNIDVSGDQDSYMSNTTVLHGITSDDLFRLANVFGNLGRKLQTEEWSVPCDKCGGVDGLHTTNCEKILKRIKDNG